MLGLLEEVTEKLSVKLEYDDLRKGVVNTPGGTYLLHGEKHILVHKRLPTAEKVDLIATLLSAMDLETVELLPEIRKRIMASSASKS